MKVSITFNHTSITPNKNTGTNYHTIPCQGVCYIANRHIGTFGDSGHKWVEIPLSEVQYFTVRTEMR